MTRHPGEHKRIHGHEAVGGGDLGPVDDNEVLGPCPSCGAELRIARAMNPGTGQVERALSHSMPFCTYYGRTDPEQIAHDVEERKS